MLTVLALVVHDAGIARAILNAPCTQPGAPGLPGAAPSTSRSMADGSHVRAQQRDPGVASAHVEARPHAPSDPALAAPCVSSVSALASLPDVPVAVVVWNARAHPLGPEAHLSSRVPSPPLRPPRAI